MCKVAAATADTHGWVSICPTGERRGSRYEEVSIPGQRMVVIVIERHYTFSALFRTPTWLSRFDVAGRRRELRASTALRG